MSSPKSPSFVKKYSMSDNEDSWQTVSSEENEFFEKIIMNKKDNQNNIRIKLFLNILELLLLIKNNKIYISNEKNQYLQYIKLKNESVDTIQLFIQLIQCKIFCKLYVFICKNKITYDIEVFLPEIIEEKKFKISGLVFSIYSTGNIINETILHSSKYTNLKLFDVIITEVAPVVEKMSIFKQFREHNQSTMQNVPKIENMFKKIPTSLIRMKYHPLYITHSMLKSNEYIQPLRPVIGYFRGEPIYLKSNIKKYLSENQWFKKGRKIKEDCINKYFKLNDKKLYRIFETEEISIEEINSKTMKYFHANHIPKKCFYIKDNMAAEVASLLKIQYAQCITGFKYQNCVFEGIFCQKKDKKLLLQALDELKFNQKLNDIVHKGENMFHSWNIVLKKVRRFIELKDIFN